MAIDIKERDKKYIAGTYKRNPLALVSGKGALAYDETGREYIDMTSGIGVNAFGFADKEWQQAISNQAAKIQHASNLFYTEPCSRLAELLCKKTGAYKVFLSNSGAEANECAIKAARRYSYLQYGPGRHYIITLKNSFHGRTLLTLTATGQDSFHKEFDPFVEGFLYADAFDIAEMKKFIEEYPVCAVMMEIVQGEGGVRALDKQFVAEVQALIKDKDILLICDEVQSGNGRTGEYFAYMHYGLQPDIVTTAKGLGGGLPIGATLFNLKTQNALSAGSHGSTFGGNPIACAAACSIVERIDDKLLQEVTAKGTYITGELTGSKGVKSVSGLGLMLGIETERPVQDLVAACIQRGVLVLTAHEKLRLLPPLNIEWEQLKKAVEIIKEELAK